MIVSEAPGETEIRENRPFVGGSGILLDHMLSRVGISRPECFLTNVIHSKPPYVSTGDAFDRFVKTGEGKIALLNGLLQLKADIESIKPNLIIGLGDNALRYLTGKQGIDSWRGSILPSYLTQGYKVICTYQPAAVLRFYNLKAVVEMDLARCASDAKFPELLYPRRELFLDPQGGKCIVATRDTSSFVETWTTQELTGFDRSGLVEELYLSPELAVDIECTERPDGSWELTCVCFADSPDRCLVVHNHNAHDRAAIERLCGSPANKILQNGTFDATVLEEQNGIKLEGYGQLRDPSNWRAGVRGHDTMLAHHSLYPECSNSEDEISKLGGRKRVAAIKKGLAFISSLNTREPYYKPDNKLSRTTGDLQLFHRYNALDGCTTLESAIAQRADLREFGTERVLEHEMSLVRPLMDATRHGLKVDLAFRAGLKEELLTEIARLQAFLDHQAGGPVNAKSAPQMQKLLYEVLKLPQKRKQGRVTADKDAIIELAEKYDHPVLMTVLAIRQRRDMLERYVQTKISPDGRIRCSFDITGTMTGRLSSRASLDGTGSNLQNQPDKIKRMYIADDGYIFVARDYKQAEAWIVAYLARAEGLITLLNDPSRDIHIENGSRIFSTPIPLVTPDQRQLAKKGGHSANYGVEEFRLMQVINQEARDSWGRTGTGVTASLSVSRKVLEGYHMLYPEIKENYWADIRKALAKDRTLVTPLDRKRTFFGRWDAQDKFLKEAYAYIPQSTVGDLCCKALVACYHELRAAVPSARVLLNIHDSLVVQCRRGDEEQVAEVMEGAMKIPLYIYGDEFIIPTDCDVGFNLMKQPKKDPSTNPNGLRSIDKWLANPHLSTGG